MASSRCARSRLAKLCTWHARGTLANSNKSTLINIPSSSPVRGCGTRIQGGSAPGELFDGMHADPAEEGVTKQCIREKDAETSGVLKPEQGEGGWRSFPQEVKRCRRQRKGWTDLLQSGRRKKRTRRGGASQHRRGDSGGCLGGEQERTDWPHSRKDVA
ncbi:hypothetical protein NDU88_002115 [Pleurodeles waltl]|uniref:Uncharacterized protein n=1 Tax=Pleurodeles waltl TaxID=8319 RepID=A0AAV7WNN7_PLEWA|nr:hypothetical protein NDU88_002115 [Pleurodeles waltl]